jgi:cholesterol oxidase
VLREPSRGRRAAYLRRFLGMCANRLVRTYAVLDEEGRFWGEPDVRKKPVEPKQGCTPHLVLWCGDGYEWHEGSTHGEDAWLQLTRFQGGPKGPVVLAPGFPMAARSFALTTNKTNLVAYLLDNHYDVWLLDTRSSIDLESARRQFSLDDIARKDWPFAISEVRNRTKSEKGVQVVGHCAGSVTFLMAMAAGLQGVRSAVCSQYTMHPRTSWFVRAKVRVPVPQFLQRLGVQTLSPDDEPRWRNKIIETTLAPIPVPRGERCGSALCRWVNLIYGMTHRHARLNDDTHRGRGVRCREPRHHQSPGPDHAERPRG